MYVILVFLRSMVGGWFGVDRKGVNLNSWQVNRYVHPFSLHMLTHLLLSLW